MRVWVLTEEYNDYDQWGGSFVDVFFTEEDARAAVDHIGRENDEYHWFELDEVDVKGGK